MDLIQSTAASVCIMKARLGKPNSKVAYVFDMQSMFFFSNCSNANAIVGEADLY